MIFKSTFLENGQYVFTETNTITKSITSLIGNVIISTVITAPFQGKTEFITPSGATSTIVKNYAVSTSITHTSAITIKSGPSTSLTTYFTVLSSTVTTYTLSTYKPSNTYTIVKFPISVYDNRIKVTDTLTATQTSTLVASTFTTTAYIVEPTTLFYVSTYDIPDTSYATYTQTDSTVYIIFSTNYVSVSTTIIPPPATKNELLGTTKIKSVIFDRIYTNVHLPSPTALILSESKIYQYSTQTTIYTSTYTTNPLNSTAYIYTFTEVTTYTGTFTKFDPAHGTTIVTSYSFSDEKKDTYTEYSVDVDESTEINVISYSVTNQISTVTSGSLQTTTYFWSSTQVKENSSFPIITYYPSNTIYVTQNNKTYSGTWTVTLVPSTTNTTATTDIFTIVPSAAFTDLPYNFTLTTQNSFISVITDPSSITTSSVATPKQSLIPGDTWITSVSYVIAKTSIIVTQFISSFAIVLPGESTIVYKTTYIKNLTTIYSIFEDNPQSSIELTNVTELEESIYINDGKDLAVISGVTTTFNQTETVTLAVSYTEISFKSADTSYTITSTLVPSPYPGETNINSISFSWTSVTSTSTFIPTYTSVTSSIYTVITLPNKTSITTYTCLLYTSPSPRD